MAMNTPRPRRERGAGPVRERLTFGHGLHAPVPAEASARTAAVIAHEPPRVRLSRLETWDWGWGGLLIFSILLFFRPQDTLKPLGAAHVSDLAAIIGLIAMCVVNTSRREPLTRVTAEVAGVAAIGAVILGTAPFSFWPGGSVHVFTDLFMQVALIYLLIVNTVTSPRRIERICWVIVLAFGYISTRVIFDYLRGIHLVEGNRAAGPVGGFFENPNDLALNLAAFLPLAMMYVKRPGPALKRLVCAGICLLMMVALVFTKSRGGFLGFIAMMVVFLLVSRSLTPMTMIAIVLGGMLVVPMMPQSFWHRMASITQPDEDPTGSRAERKMLMEKAWHVFVDNPITGVGAGQFQNLVDPDGRRHWRVTHNALLQVASELGVLGLIPFVFVIIRGFTAAFWTRSHLSWIYHPPSRGRPAPEPEDGLEPDERYYLQTHAAAMVACMTGWFVCALFASVAFNWTLYYLLGLSATARDVVRTRERAYAKAKRLAAREASAA
jgi:O-antigen ligase